MANNEDEEFPPIEWDDEDQELLSAATRDLRLHSNLDQGPIE